MQINAYIYIKKFASDEKISSTTTAFDKRIRNAFRGRPGYRKPLGFAFKRHLMGQVCRPVLPELQDEPWGTHKRCKTGSGSGDNQAYA